MAQRNIFICDKCKKEWVMGNNECPQPVAISVVLNYGSMEPIVKGFSTITTRSQVWCRDCIDTQKIAPPVPQAAQTQHIPSTEDILIDLFTQMGFVRE